MTQAEIIKHVRVADHNNLGPVGRALAVEAEAMRDVQVENSSAVKMWRILRESYLSVEQFRDEWNGLTQSERDELLALA